MLFRYALLVCVVCATHAQTLVDLRTQSKSVDFTAASTTKPMKAGKRPARGVRRRRSIFPNQCTRGIELVSLHLAEFLDAAVGHGGPNRTDWIEWRDRDEWANRADWIEWGDRSRSERGHKPAG